VFKHKYVLFIVWIIRSLFYILGFLFSLATFYSVNTMDLIEQMNYGFNFLKTLLIKWYNYILDKIKINDLNTFDQPDMDDVPEPKLLSSDLSTEDKDYDRLFQSLENKINNFEKKIMIGDGLGHEWNLDSLKNDSYLKYFVIFLILFSGTLIVSIYGDSLKRNFFKCV
jgi:hypothetical protein